MGFSGHAARTKLLPEFSSRTEAPKAKDFDTKEGFRDVQRLGELYSCRLGVKARSNTRLAELPALPLLVGGLLHLPA